MILNLTREEILPKKKIRKNSKVDYKLQKGQNRCEKKEWIYRIYLKYFFIPKSYLQSYLLHPIFEWLQQICRNLIFVKGQKNLMIHLCFCEKKRQKL